ncbi:hypothetical protein GCM10009646_60270 [Streptomyces aureus]
MTCTVSGRGRWSGLTRPSTLSATQARASGSLLPCTRFLCGPNEDRCWFWAVGRAQAEGLQLTGEGGLLQQLTKRLLESALEGEVTDHLGYDRHEPTGKNGGNSRNGTRVQDRADRGRPGGDRRAS